jgi:hypothetical protein
VVVLVILEKESQGQLRAIGFALFLHLTLLHHVAEQYDIPASLVDDIVSFYYKEVRKNLSSLENLRVNLPGLGHFIIQKKSVDALILKYRNLNNKYDTQTFINYHNKKSAEQKLEKLTAAIKKINEFLETKKAFRDGKKVDKHLEE